MKVSVFKAGLLVVIQLVFVKGSVIPIVMATSNIATAANESPTDDLPYPIRCGFLNGTIGGEIFEFEGDAQQIRDQFEAKFPGMANFDSSPVVNGSTSDSFNATLIKGSDSDALAKRKHPIWPPLCIPIANWGWEGVTEAGLGHAVTAARRIPAIAIRKKSCAKVGCADQSAIIVCNDADHNKFLSTYYITNRAYDIRRYCRTQRPRDWRVVGGQGFDDEGWNTIVRRDNC